jgi:hypothetical protein
MVVKTVGFAQDMEQVEVDLRKLTARDMIVLQGKQGGGLDVEGVAGIYARIVTKCPAAWGKPDDPETYLNLPFDYEFTEIGKKIGEMRKALQGN